MQISLTLPANGLTVEQARDILGEAIQDETAQAQVRMAYFAGLCREREADHQMSSAEFVERYDAVGLGEGQYLLDWYAAKQGLGYWTQRYHLLSKVTL